MLEYRAGDMLPAFSRTIGLTGTARRFPFDTLGIEEIVFVTTALQANGRFNTFAMDEVQRAVVSEPGSLVLFALG